MGSDSRFPMSQRFLWRHRIIPNPSNRIRLGLIPLISWTNAPNTESCQRKNRYRLDVDQSPHELPNNRRASLREEGIFPQYRSSSLRTAP